MTDRETVARDFFLAWSSPELDQLMEFFHDDAVYQDPRTVRRGRDEVRAELQEHIANVGSTTAEILSIASAGDTVLVERAERFRFAGTELTVEGVVAFDIDDQGRITRMRDYFDQASIERQFPS